MGWLRRDEALHRELRHARAELEQLNREQRALGIDRETLAWKRANERVDRLWRRSTWRERLGTRAD